MPENVNDAASRLWWGMRAYAWILLACVPLVAGVTVATTPASPITREYRASALVIATDLQIRPELLGRFAEGVFAGGSVAERAVQEGKLSLDPRALIPTHARLEPIQENILVRVVGVDRDAELAARIANSAAAALVAELNKAGPGVGTFAVQDQARVPRLAVQTTGLPAPLLVGVLAGLVLGIGLIGVLMIVRRPVLTPAEAADAAGAPIIGAPGLPNLRRGALPDPESVPGLTALVKRLYPSGTGTCALIGTGSDERARTMVAQLVARVLERRSAVFLVASAEQVVRPLYDRVPPPVGMIVTRQIPDRSVWRRAAIVIDGPTARGRDLPQSIPPGASAALVVRQGATLATVQAAASQFLPGELTGVVFVRLGRRWPSFWGHGTTSASEATRTREVDLESRLEARRAPAEARPQPPAEIRLDPDNGASRGDLEAAGRRLAEGPFRREDGPAE